MAAGLTWNPLPPLPDREGFAGAFAGVSGDSLLVAGGANFPQAKPWEGGKKVWHDTVFALEKPEGAWRVIGRLPRPLAYGVSVSARDGVICIGGSDAGQHYAEVFLLSSSNGVAHRLPLPSLPVPLANAAGALVGQVIHVCGGSERPGEESATGRLFLLDLAAPKLAWIEGPGCPGKPRILPLAAAVDGGFYLAGGAALERTNGSVARVYLRDTWCYQGGRGWKRRADLPWPAVGAPTPAPAAGSRFYVLGGDDGSLAGFQPVERHPGFAGRILAYDAESDLWTQQGQVPAPRATPPAAWWRGRFVLPSGEVRPGVRSPEVWTLRLEP